MKKENALNTYLITIICMVLTATIFVVDLFTPLGIAIGMSYSIIVLLTVWLENKMYTIMLTLISAILIIIGYFLSPTAGNVHYMAITNRLLSELCILTGAFIILKYKNVEKTMKSQYVELEKMSEQLKEYNLNLESQVKERTKVLEQTLSDLEISKNKLSIALAEEKELTALKSRIIAMASHEFRTPLATILSSLDLVSKYNGSEKAEKQLKHFNRIRTSISHLTNLLEDTLSVSKLEEGKMTIKSEKTNIDEFVSELISEMQEFTKTGQKLNYSHDGDHQMMIDKKVLRRILTNLVSNAIKFSSENSIINVSSNKDMDTLLLVIKDDGIGIPEKDMKRLFSRFFRAENAFNIQGTGLGLCIVDKYVKLLEGEIDVKSEENIGSTFTIKLPVKTDLSSAHLIAS